MNHSKNTKIIPVLGYFAAGTNKRTSSIVDMQGFEGVEFVALFGTLIAAGTIDVYAEQDDVNATTDMSRVPATTTPHTVTTADALLALSAIRLDIYQPEKRYVQCNIKPASQSEEILGMIAILYNGKVKPITDSSLVIASFFNQSPAEV